MQVWQKASQRKAGAATDQALVSLQKENFIDPTGADFFAFENKIRQMVMELIDPLTKRSIQDRDTLIEVQA